MWHRKEVKSSNNLLQRSVLITFLPWKWKLIQKYIHKNPHSYAHTSTHTQIKLNFKLYLTHSLNNKALYVYVAEDTFQHIN